MATRTFTLTGPSIGKIRRGLRRLDQQPQNLRVPMQGDSARITSPDGRLHFRNDSGETVPAYAAIKVTGLAFHEKRIIYTVDKSDSGTELVLINGPKPIASSGGDRFGVAQGGIYVRAMVDPADSPTLGDQLSWKSGQWYLDDVDTHPVAKFIGLHQDNDNTAIVEIITPSDPGFDLALYYLNADLTAGGTVSGSEQTWNSGAVEYQTTGSPETLYDFASLGPAKSGDIAWCIPASASNSGFVEIVSLPGGSDLILVKLDADCGPNDDVTCSIYSGTQGSESDSTNNLTAWNRGPGILFQNEYAFVLADADGYYIVSPDGRHHKGKTTGTHNKGATGTIDIYKGTSATAFSVTAKNEFANVANGKYVFVSHDGNEWVMTAGEC